MSHDAKNVVEKLNFACRLLIVIGLAVTLFLSLLIAAVGSGWQFELETYLKTLFFSLVLLVLVLLGFAYYLENKILIPIRAILVQSSNLAVRAKAAVDKNQVVSSQKIRWDDPMWEPVAQPVNDLVHLLHNCTQVGLQRKWLLKTILDALPQPILVTNRVDQVWVSNRFLEETLELKIIPKSTALSEVVKDQDVVDLVNKILKGEKTRGYLDGVDLWNGVWSLWLYPVYNEDALVVGVVLVFQDASLKEKMKQDKKNFVTYVSHQLKTPLAIIKGYLMTIHHGTPDRMLDRCIAKTNEMLDTVDRMIRLGQYEHQDVLVKSMVDTESLTYYVRDDFQDLLQEKSIQLQLDCQLPKVYADKETLILLVSNLLDNAIKFSSQNGIISIKWFKDEHNNSVLEVKDQGMGFSEEESEKIFERFYRGRETGGESTPGSGIGLALVKHIAGLHHAHIEVESKIGHGAKFQVFFPNT